MYCLLQCLHKPSFWAWLRSIGPVVPAKGLNWVMGVVVVGLIASADGFAMFLVIGASWHWPLVNCSSHCSIFSMLMAAHCAPLRSKGTFSLLNIFQRMLSLSPHNRHYCLLHSTFPMPLFHTQMHLLFEVLYLTQFLMDSLKSWTVHSPICYLDVW